MRRILIILAMVLLLGSAVLGVAVYSIPVDSKEYLGAKVEYRQSFIFGPNFEIELPQKGYGIVTVSLLLPNGSLMDLGTFSGQDKIKISYGRLVKAAEIWDLHLKTANIDPSAVSPSLLLMGTLQDENGNVKYFIKAVPINVGKVLEGRSIQVKLPRESSKTLYSGAQIREKFRPAGPQKANGDAASAATENWPPSFDYDQCYPVCDPWTGICYPICLVWKLEEVITSAPDTIIPLAAFQVTGNTNAINAVVITALYKQKTVQNLELSFSAAAALEKGDSSSSIEAEVAGFSYTINTKDLSIPGSDTLIWGSRITSPSVIGAGIKGNVVLAKYRLYWWNGFSSLPLGDVAYVILGKPDEGDMNLRSFVEPGWPGQDGGIMRKTMWFVHSYWEPSFYKEETGRLVVYDLNYVQSTQTLPLFAASAAVLGTLSYSNLELAPFVMAVGVGFNTDSVQYSLLHVAFLLKEEYQDGLVAGKVYSSKIKFHYNGNEYKLAGMYGDVYVSTGGNLPPCEKRTGICPLSGDSDSQ